MSVAPDWKAGSKVTKARIAQQQIQVITSSSTQVVNNSTTTVDDNELVVALDANASYILELQVAFDNANTTPGYRTAWSMPTGATGFRYIFGSTQTGASFTDETNTKGKVVSGGLTVQSTHRSGTADQSHSEWLTVVTTNAGNAQFQFAQQTANASNTTRLENSYIRVQRVA